MARFSIVTACRNSAGTIEQCMQSVSGQRGVELEHIVVDGNSTDGTLDIVARNRDDRRVVLTGADQGIADAFNRGLARATGDVVGFLNSDDWYASEDSLAAVHPLLRGDRAIVCGAMDLVSPDGSASRRLESDPSRLRRGMYVRHPATFVPTELLRAMGGFDTRYRIAMDFDLITRLRLAGAEFVVIDKTITRMRAGGASWNISRVLREDLDIKNRHYGRGLRNYRDFAVSYVVIKVRSALGRF
jgi:glycosyltransferase involved in cell wall biosynthesis